MQASRFCSTIVYPTKTTKLPEEHHVIIAEARIVSAIA